MMTCFVVVDLFTGSDDGSDDAVVGNLNKFAVVPPGYTGMPKKGHLIFDACFECGKALQDIPELVIIILLIRHFLVAGLAEA